MKKLGILVLACITAINLWAQEGFKIGKLTFAIETPTTVGLINADEDITKAFLSETIDYNGNSYTLTYIGFRAFEGCSALTSVTIPNSVTIIWQWAFRVCSSLTSITIPNSVTNIGEEAFEGTALYENPANWENGALYIDNCLIKVDEGFAGHFRIKENTRVIAGGAFEGCSALTSVTIPNSVKEIGEEAFADCSSLTSVTIPNSVTSIGWFAFLNCSSLTSVTIPNSVTSIRYGAFEGCKSLTSIVVASGNSTYDSRDNCNAIIETAKNTLIAGCQNTTIPNSVTSIGHWAFRDCSSLTSVTIPNSVTSIGYMAFLGCSSLTSITIPNSVTSIGDKAFYYCSSLTSVTIPNSVKYIGWGAFEGCSALTSVTIPNSVKEIGEEAFVGTALYENPANWENGALYIDNCLIKVDEGFAGHFRIKENTRVIAGGAFEGCSALTSVTIPNSVTRIEQGEFEGTALYKNPANWENGALYIDNCLIRVDKGFAGHFRIKENTRVIAGGAFAWCESLTSVTIPNSVKYIGWGAFERCKSLTSMVVASGNSTYDSRDNCNAIIETATNTLIAGCQNTTIPNSVTSIGGAAFACSSLTSVTIPNSVKSIGKMAFERCSSLTSVTIPNSVTSIGWGAFKDCSALTSVTISNSVTSIGDYAFYGCSALTSVTIPNSVKEIGYDAFPSHTKIIRR